jgi:hypothetical protein
MHPRADLYALALVNGYNRGRIYHSREYVVNQWLSDKNTRASLWVYDHQVIAVILNGSQRWLYLRDAGFSPRLVFKRFSFIMHRMDLGYFSKIKKHWFLFPKNAQYNFIWKGQWLFSLQKNADEPPLPSIIGRIQSLIPKNFSKTPFWEKNLLWKPVEHP